MDAPGPRLVRDGLVQQILKATAPRMNQPPQNVLRALLVCLAGFIQFVYLCVGCTGYGNEVRFSEQLAPILISRDDMVDSGGVLNTPVVLRPRVKPAELSYDVCPQLLPSLGVIELSAFLRGSVLSLVAGTGSAGGNPAATVWTAFVYHDNLRV